MIRLGLRLTLGSGREAALRVLVTAAAVALGVGLLLASLAGGNGLHAQTDRGAWLDTSAQASPPTSVSGPLWWLSVQTHPVGRDWRRQAMRNYLRFLGGAGSGGGGGMIPAGSHARAHVWFAGQRGLYLPRANSMAWSRLSAVPWL